ncbi:hypothetical protein BDR26DRAFT_854913 [Obelidium mucronatum]|nr:hypothetical protein BDR26DRAFT_854913 [Obelidium mucronatum]
MVEITTTVGKLSEDLEISRKETVEVLLKNHDLERQVEESKLRESKSTAQNVELSGSLDSVKADRNSLAAQLQSVRCQAVQTASIEVQTEYMPPLKEDRPEPPPAVHPILTRQDTRDPYSFAKSVRVRLDGMMEKTAIERVAITNSLHHTDDNLIDIIQTAVFREEALCPVSRLLEVAKLAHQSHLKQLVEECLEFYILFALEDWHAIWLYGFCEDLRVRQFSDQLKIICARGMSALFNNWAWGQFSPLCPLQEGKAKLRAWSLFQVSKFASHRNFTTRHKWVILIAWVKAQQGLADVNPRGGMRGLNVTVARQMIHGVNHLLAEGLVETGGPCRFFTEHVQPYLPLISSQDRYKNALGRKCQKAALQLLAAE